MSADAKLLVAARSGDVTAAREALACGANKNRYDGSVRSLKPCCSTAPRWQLGAHASRLAACADSRDLLALRRPATRR
jgi:hypothetical protein